MDSQDPNSLIFSTGLTFNDQILSQDSITSPPNKRYNMTNDQIEKFLSDVTLDKSPVQISFKTRNTILGMFIKTADYAELKSKNFWRIVNETNMENYKKSGDINLARIFSGMEFTRLKLAATEKI